MSEKKRPKIGLNMIVKNEEAVIKRVLDSVSGIVDWYTIVDTGSTDNTKKVIKEVMDSHGIEGEIIDHKWVNFCDARNRALKEIKGKADWGLWIDADEELLFDKEFTKDKLLEELSPFEGVDVKCQIMTVYGDAVYARDQIFSINSDWEWKGAVHEILVIKDPTTQQPGRVVSYVRTKVYSEGASWGDGSRETQKAKYLEHAKMMLDYIKEDNNPRWIFYLAQSYRDAFEWEEAIKWYRKRVEIFQDGYWEERYVSQLMVAQCMANLEKEKGLVIHEFLKCAPLDWRRVEHLIPVISHYQQQDNNPIAYSFSKYAWDHCSKNPFPNSRLFLSNDVYTYQLLDCHMVSCYRMGKQLELRRLMPKMQNLITFDKIPNKDLQRIKKNMTLFEKALQTTGMA